MKTSQLKGFFAAACCLTLAGSAHAVVGGTTTDAWDVSVGGTVVTGSSGFLFGGACGPSMFGASLPGVCAEGASNTLFADYRAAGFLHYIEWQTTTPVTIESFNLSAGHDGHVYAPAGQCDLPTFFRDAQHRGFSRFTLLAWNGASGAFDILLYDYLVPLGDDNGVHAGENARLYDPDALINVNRSVLDLTDNVLASVSSDRWRAEFVQVGCPSNESGPRIFELDGFLDPIISDTDDDGIPDDADNCPLQANPLQEDNENDGIGDVCDDDDDNDGVDDWDDNCPTDANPSQDDIDIDGLGDACDDNFGGDALFLAIETLVLDMRDIIVAVSPPGGNGMIAKLTGNGGILKKVGNALSDFGAGLIGVDDYLDMLADALDKLDAFDNQLAAKIGNGQIPAVTEGDDLQALSADVRVLIEDLVAAAGG